MKKKIITQITTKTIVELTDTDIISFLKDKYGKDFDVEFDIGNCGILNGVTLTKVETREN